jgi:glycosyltransferase involved in cell wall biosynthesis
MVDRMDGRAFSRADHVLCVSTVLLAEVRARFALACPASVIPCVADERRFFPDAQSRARDRAALGLASEPLLVYAGSIDQWHQFESTLDTFQGVARRDARARFLIATREAEKATVLVSTRPELKDRAIVRHGDADEVARWLNAADVGLLLREVHPLNRVACPTKFGEYVLSGLSVVVSEEVGDLGSLVHDLDLGLCIRGADAAAAAVACGRLIEKRAEEGDRVGLVQRASPVLSMGARLQDWIEAYRAAAEPVAS